MITLYHGSGAQDCTILDDIPRGSWDRLRSSVIRLLSSRGSLRAAEILETIPFELSEGTNFFQDDFSVMHLTLPIEEYATFEEGLSPQDRRAYRTIADVMMELGTYVRFIVVNPDTTGDPHLVPDPQPSFTTQAVERALHDAQQLLQSVGAVSAVDRVHTALHGYLVGICQRDGYGLPTHPSVTDALKVLREKHPALQAGGPGGDDVRRIVQALATIVDAMNTLRNRMSLAHANPNLLDEPEAILMVNSARTLLHYLDAKLR